METTGIQTPGFADPWGHGASVAREKAFEHAFLADLTRAMLLAGQRCEILRSEFDAAGHDLVLESGGVVRHIQLKAMRADGKRAHVDVNIDLTVKPSGCVIWMLIDPVSLKIQSFRWFGAGPGFPLPPLGDRAALHSKANSLGKKTVRPGLRRLVGGQFERVPDMAGLIERLFGDPIARDTNAIRRNLRSQSPTTPTSSPWQRLVQQGVFDLMPERLDEFELIEFTHLADGYGLAGLTTPEAIQTALAGLRQDDFDQDILPSTLWGAMFVEHRRLRLQNRAMRDDERHWFDDAYNRLRRLLAGGW